MSKTAQPCMAEFIIFSVRILFLHWKEQTPLFDALFFHDGIGHARTKNQHLDVWQDLYIFHITESISYSRMPSYSYIHISMMDDGPSFLRSRVQRRFLWATTVGTTGSIKRPDLSSGTVVDWLFSRPNFKGEYATVRSSSQSSQKTGT
jgi:hypothetical protein